MKGLLLFFLLLPVWGFAQDSRWIDIEWEEVPEAKEYQIELFQNEESGEYLPRGKFKTDSAKWSHAVSPGKYSLRIRSVDHRGVPGEWGPYLPLKVRMQNPLLLLPSPAEKMDKATVNFSWSGVKGADNYQLVVRNKEKDLLLNILTKDLKYSAFMDSLGDYEWTVFALDKGEERKTSEELDGGIYRQVTRVGGELDAPIVDATVNDKVVFSWKKVRESQVYEVDYLPPPNSGDKNRRFKLKLSPLVFSVSKLKEGVTTLTIRSQAPGYQDSPKSLVKISRSGNKVEVEDVIQGQKEKALITEPSSQYFKNELFFAVSLSQFKYESRNYATDTQMKQKSLTGLGLNGEWHRRKTQESLNQKLEFSLLQLSSGIDSGFATHLGYTWNKEKKWRKKRFTYGGGVSYLSLPSFMGDRFNNDIKVESTSSLGPEIQLGFFNAFTSTWAFDSHLAFAYHPFFVSSRESGEKALPWMRLQGRFLKYYTDKQAFFVGLEYQTWSQDWSKDESALDGVTLNLGIKTGF